MRIYLLMSFWAGVLGAIFRMCHIVNNDYPRTQTYASAAEDLMWLIFGGCMTVWVSNLLWAWI